MTRIRSEAGFSMMELMVATGLMLVVSAIVTTAMLQMRSAQRTISNRTAMHSGIRGATELLQQEVGQAGRVSLPGGVPATLTGAVAAAAYCDGTNPLVNAVPATVSSTTGMFGGMSLTTLDGDNSETIKVNSAAGNTINACFTRAHPANAQVTTLGGFATGVVPPTGIVDGSNDTTLKLYGDINGDGNMVYVEYTCDYPSRNLYRNVFAYNAGGKTAPGNSQILLSNVVVNPGGTACFQYQTAAVAIGATTFTFVLDVAVTLTVETEQVDPTTNTRQQETKALLNVSPRNVFDAWAYASMNYTFRVQSTPVSITTLIHPLS